jgi:hypothetical protein
MNVTRRITTLSDGFALVEGRDQRSDVTNGYVAVATDRVEPVRRCPAGVSS